MKRNRLVLLLLITIGLASCGQDPLVFPAETDCVYYDVDPVGSCQRQLELCTFAGKQCMATLMLCPYQSVPTYQPNGCEKP